MAEHFYDCNKGPISIEPENSFKDLKKYFALGMIMNGRTSELNTQVCSSNKETVLHPLKDGVQGGGGDAC